MQKSLTKIAILSGSLLFNSFLPVPTYAQDAGGAGEGKGDWSAALPYYNRANKRLNESRYDEAVQDFNEAISRYPDDPDFYTNLGVALRKLGKYAEAEQAYKKAIQLNPRDWTPWSDLANVYLKQDKLKETVATFGEVLKHDPPASEQEAIKKDIADIKKIMSMQGKATTATGAKPEPTPAWQPGDTGKADEKKSSSPKPNSKLTKSLTPKSPVQSPSALASPDPKASAAGGATQSQNSDWGYSQR